MNNKGFAVSGILYTVLLVFLCILMMLLFNFEGKKNILDKIKSETLTELTGEYTNYTKYANGTAIYFNPETGNICSESLAVSTTGTKTGCMKWYIFNDTGDESSVNMILDHNTTAQIVWNSTNSNVSGPTNILTQLASDTSSWIGLNNRTDNYSVNNGTANYTINYNTYKARLITAAEIATITGNSSFVEVTTPSTGWFYFDSNNQTQTITTLGASNYKWLFDYTNDCTSYGCSIADASTNGYWTSTAVDAVSYLAWFVNKNGNLTNGTINLTGRGVRPVITIPKSVLTTEICDINLNQEYLFDYTGGEQEFNVPCNGNYKLETWGAQGGSYNTTYYGGYGAYSTGKVELSKNDELYVVAGGTGAPISGITTGLGGYNGGGGRTGNWTTSTTATQIYGTGGGATHIALSSGLLSTLSSKISDILLVAAGGGGATYMYYPTVAYWYNNGGAGGGISGEKYTVISATSTYKPYLTQNTMSTQTESGTITYYGTTTKNGLFGVGGSSITGGGGGFYGGSSHVVGNGGSSYIGNLLLTDKVMYCYSCTESSNETTKTISTTNVSTIPTSNYAKQGNGYAKITYLGK